VHLQIEFPFSHNLNQLLDLLPDNWEAANQYPDLAQLSEWAVAARYPGDWTMPTEDDARLALNEARAVLILIQTEVERRQAETPDTEY
jgi:hypothetical protein